MVLRPPRAGMADQPVKKRQKIDGGEDVADPAPPSEPPDGKDAVDCTAPMPSSIAVHNNPSCSSISNWNAADDTLLAELRSLQGKLVGQCLCKVPENALTQLFDRKLNLVSWPLTCSLSYLSTMQLMFDVYLKQNNTGIICSRLMFACDTLVRNRHNWVTEVIELSDHKSKYLTYIASKVLASFLIVSKDTVDENWLQQIAENIYSFDRINRITVQKINFSLDIIKRIVEWKDVDQHPLEDNNYTSKIKSHTIQEDNPFRNTNTSGQSSSSNEVLSSAFSGLQTNGASTSSGIKEEHASTFKLQEPVLKFPQTQEETENSEEELENQPAPSRIERLTDLGCVTVVLTDSESFDTSHIKCLTIKTLEIHWLILVKHMKLLIQRYLNLPNSENCILTFFSLWENIISVKTNLSVIDTKPFYTVIQSFVDLLRITSLPSLIYLHLLSLFNEVLCYGSTLALQDILPEETCSLAHSIVRFVKDFRLLHDVQVRNPCSGFPFIGQDCPVLRDHTLGPVVSSTIQLVDQGYGDEVQRNEIDKPLLQRISLLVLKSIAVTVKEMRCDSSDSSIDSTDYNAIQDMQIVERSIRDVLKKLDYFIRSSMEFHPETPFTKMLIHLFSEQDDYLIESMVCTLDITIGIVYRNSVYPDLIPMLNPISSFIEFLAVVSYDSDVLLDYLVSNETCFLLYLLRFLKYVRRNWAKFVETCDSGDSGSTQGLDDTMRVLIRLRFQISRLVSKCLFPYNISPVLRLLEVCESLYEGNEFS